MSEYTGSGRSCFCIGPIGEPDSDERCRSDRLMRHVLKPTLEPLGYSITRADEDSVPGLITQQIVDRLLQSDLVVADLTGMNPNCFYELGIRHASQLPVVHLALVGYQFPFDVKDYRTILYCFDIDAVEQVNEELDRQVQAIDAGEGRVGPVTIALALRALQSEQSPIATSIAAIVSMLESQERQVALLARSARVSAGGPLMDLKNFHRTVEGLLDITDRLLSEDPPSIERAHQVTRHAQRIMVEIGHSVRSWQSLATTRAVDVEESLKDLRSLKLSG